MICGIILAALITVMVVVFLVKPFQPKTITLPKTISVLRFYHDSQDSTNAHALSGIMEEILNKSIQKPSICDAFQ